MKYSLWILTALLATYVGSYELSGKLSFLCETRVRSYGSVVAGQIFVPAAWTEAKVRSKTVIIHVCNPPDGTEHYDWAFEYVARP